MPGWAIAFIVVGWIRFYVNVVSVIVGLSHRPEELDQEDIDYMINSTKCFAKWFLRVSGTMVDNKRLPDETILPVFQKYFGPEYKIEYDGKFGCLISNHTSIYDNIIAMYNFGNGFVARENVKDIPFVGQLMTELQTIFVDRSSRDSKNNTFNKLTERQYAYYEGKPVIPILIFPEGTTTSGRHLIQFKKGAFSSLLPLKANIINPNLSKDCQLACGSSDAFVNFLRDLSTLYSRIEYIELPIMTPNEYMFNNFKDLGNEKWEIYAEVAREIMCTLGRLKKSNAGIRDRFRYNSCLKEKTYLDRDTYKFRDKISIQN